LKKVEDDKKRAQIVPALVNLKKPSFYQDLYTAKIEHIKELKLKIKAHYEKNPLKEKGCLMMYDEEITPQPI